MSIALAEATESEPVTRRRLSGVDIALLVAVLLGIALRIRMWWADVELPNDDIALMYGAAYLGPPELFGPLPVGQSAPPLWLLIERGIAELLGRGERSLRLLPFVLGCAQLVVMAGLSRRALGGLAATVATALMAIAPFAAFYSATAKQYTGDLLATTTLVLLALVIARRGQLDARAVLGWWIAAVVAGTLSQPTLLLTPALTLVLVIALRRARGMIAFLSAGLLWVAGAALFYVLNLRPTSQSGTLQKFWADGYPPTQHIRDLVKFPARALDAFAGDVVLSGAPVPTNWSLAIVALIAVGAVVLFFRDRLAAIVVTTPIAVALVAAAAHLYPLEKRLALWLLPSVLLLVSAVVVPWRRRATAVVGVLAVAAAVGAPTAISAAEEVRRPMARDLTLTDPAYTDDNRPVLTQLRGIYRPSDVVIPLAPQYHATQWYAGRFGVPVVGYLAVFRSQRCKPAEWLAKLPASSRYLLVAGSPWGTDGRRGEDAIVAGLRQVGSVTLLAEDGGVRLWSAEPNRPVPEVRNALCAGVQLTGPSPFP